MTPYYQDDLVTIYHGDCVEVLANLDPFHILSLVTDPPYGLGDLMDRPGDGKWQKLWGGGAPSWDTSRPDNALRMALDFAPTDLVVWGGNYFELPVQRGWLVWDKLVREFSSGHCELAWTNLDQPVRAFNYSHGQLASEGKLHPTQKPLPLMLWCTAMTRGPVIDPFMGSGTTLVAAKALGRKSIGIEIEERYCEIAAKRCSQEVLGLVG